MSAFVIRSAPGPSAPRRTGSADVEGADDAQVKALWDAEGVSHAGPVLRRRGGVAFVRAQGASVGEDNGKARAEAEHDARTWYLKTLGGADTQGSVAAGPSRFVYRAPPAPRPLVNAGDGRSASTALTLADSDPDSPPASPRARTAPASGLVCPICAKVIDPPTARAQMLHNQSMGISHQLPVRTKAPVVPPISYGLKPGNVGWKMLEGLGWAEGRGLGHAPAGAKSEADGVATGAGDEPGEGVTWVRKEGVKVPLRASNKQDRLGLGMSSSLSSTRALASRRQLPTSARAFLASQASGEATLGSRRSRRRARDELVGAEQSAMDGVAPGDEQAKRLAREEGAKRRRWVEKDRDERNRSRALLAYMNAE